MALSMDQAMQLLDFSSGKLDVQLLDSVVCRFYEGNGPEVCNYKVIRNFNELNFEGTCMCNCVVSPQATPQTPPYKVEGPGAH